MKKLFIPVLVFLFAIAISVVLLKAQTAGTKSVERLDPALDELVSPDAQVQMVKTGFGFTEGTNWVQHGKEGYLLFCDIPANAVMKMTPDGTTSVYFSPSGYDGPWNGYTMVSVGGMSSNAKDPKDPEFKEFVNIGADGMTIDPQGRVVLATYAGRSIERIEKGKRVLIADRLDGKRFGGPNDVIVKKDGTIYFSDTFSGMRNGARNPSKEIEFNGIFMIKNGNVSVAIKVSPDGLPGVNGLALSPDEKYLYANGGNRVFRYEVQPDDTVTNGKLFADMRPEKPFVKPPQYANLLHYPGEPGGADGMRVDSKGNVYETGPNGIWIFSPEGKHLGTIHTPNEAVANLTFGDPDYKTIYFAARPTIYKIRVNTPGLPCNSCTK